MGDDPRRITVDDESYRDVMRLWPSGVSVVTMPTPGGAHGMTASAFTSVSISPPLVLVVVDKRWRSHDFIADAGAFCVNVLGEDQARISDRFAGRQGKLEDPFEGLDVGTAVTGAPHLLGALAYLDCRVDGVYDAGDHTIFVGRVVAAGVHREGRPLLYVNRAYARVAPVGTAGG